MKLQCLFLLLLLSSITANPTFTASLESTAEPPEAKREPEANGPAATDFQTREDSSEEQPTSLEIQFKAEMQQIRQQCSEAIQRTRLNADAVTSLNSDLSRSRSEHAELKTDLESELSRAANAREAAARRVARLETEIAALRSSGSAAAKEQRHASQVQAETTRKLRTQLTGLAALTSAFAQQTNLSVRAAVQKLTHSLSRLEASFQEAKSAMETRVKGLEGRQEACELRLSLWNVSRTLQKCRKASRDVRQEAELDMLRQRTNHLATSAAGLRNLTETLQRVLYDNNRITNSLTNFRDRARRAIDSLVLNMAHMAKTLAKSCSSESVETSSPSSILLIVPDFHAGDMRAVQCLFTEIDSWTVIQRREKFDVDFNRRWAEYEAGFGEMQSDYWLGLRLIHNIVASGKWKLRIDLWDEEGSYYYAVYRHFYVGTRASNYRLSVGGYYGNASDTLSRASGYGFSTTDRDADATVVHCAQFEEAGWWMAHCHDSNLNGKKPFGIIWYHTPRKDYLRLRRTRMMVAPLTDADLTTEAPMTTETPTSSEVEINETQGPEGNDTVEAFEDFDNSTDEEGFVNATENEENWLQNSTDVDYEWSRKTTAESEDAGVIGSVDPSTNLTESRSFQNTTIPTNNTKPQQNVTQITSGSNEPIKPVTPKLTENPMITQLPTKKPEKAAQPTRKPLKMEEESGNTTMTDQSEKGKETSDKELRVAKEEEEWFKEETNDDDGEK